jgi:hypothetical protein
MVVYAANIERFFVERRCISERIDGSVARHAEAYVLELSDDTGRCSNG